MSKSVYKDFIWEVLVQHPVHELCEFLFILLLAKYGVDTYVCACVRVRGGGRVVVRGRGGEGGEGGEGTAEVSTWKSTLGHAGGSVSWSGALQRSGLRQGSARAR